MNRKIISLLLTLTLVVSACPTAYALGTNSISDEVTCTDAVPNERLEEENNILRYGERPVVTVLESETITKITKPTGQPPHGYSFPSYGGSVFINATEGPSLSVDVSVGWQIADTVTISISVGAVTGQSSGVGGYSVWIPADNNFYVVKLKQYYIVEHIRVDTYRGNEIIDSYETIRSRYDRTQAYLEKVA